MSKLFGVMDVVGLYKELVLTTNHAREKDLKFDTVVSSNKHY
jgi:hypothetical protein